MKRVGALIVWVTINLVSGCRQKTDSEPISKAKSLTAGGTRIASGKAFDLRLSPDREIALYLKDALKPAVEGIPPQMVVGRLYRVALSSNRPADRSEREVAAGVTNLPGGYFVSADSKWLVAVDKYQASTQSGGLVVAGLKNAEPSTRVAASGVEQVILSPDSKWMAFINQGQLMLGALPSGPFRPLVNQAVTGAFAPDSRRFYFKRSFGSGGGLYYTSTQAGPSSGEKFTQLGEQVGDFSVSNDSCHVAFTVRSASPGIKGGYDLRLASEPRMTAVLKAVGAGVFSFSADSKWFAFVEGQKPELLGSLRVEPLSGGSPVELGAKVSEAVFAPDSSAIAYLEHFDIGARAGVLKVATLPERKPIWAGDRVPNFSWGSDGEYLAFLSRFLKPLYSVDLMLFRMKDRLPSKIQPGVFGYGFGPANRYLLYRTQCVRNGRACNLFSSDLKNPKSTPEKWVEGVYSFKPSVSGDRVLVSYARTDSPLYDLASYQVTAKSVRTVDTDILLPAFPANESGSRVAYLEENLSRQGVYLSEALP